MHNITSSYSRIETQRDPNEEKYKVFEHIEENKHTSKQKETNELDKVQDKQYTIYEKNQLLQLYKQTKKIQTEELKYFENEQNGGTNKHQTIQIYKKTRF